MTNLKWHKVGKYNRKIMWNKQNLNLPELKQDVLIFSRAPILVAENMSILQKIFYSINMEGL